MTAYSKPIGCHDNQTSIRANLASNDTAEEKEINGILGKLKFFFFRRKNLKGVFYANFSF